MARANLTVSQELKDAFETACTAGNIRCVRAEIQKETITVCTQPTLTVSGDSETDFAILAAEKISPRYYLWNSEPSDSSAWILIAFVDENKCKVRDKMLYASSHKDMTNELGSSLFKGQFYCNDPNEFTYQGVAEALRSNTVGAPLTEAEEARQAEEKASLSSQAATGMSTLPFQLTLKATEKLVELNNGTVNFVELMVNDSEAVDLRAAKSLGDASEIATSMDTENGRFYALRYPVNEDGKLFFVLSCPEATPVRQRMVLATVKATVLEACKGAGLDFLKMMEVQDVEDIEADLISEIKSSTEDRSLKNDAQFSKPKGPGGGRRRGKRRMMTKK